MRDESGLDPEGEEVVTCGVDLEVKLGSKMRVCLVDLGSLQCALYELEELM